MSVNKGYFIDLFRDRKLSMREVAKRIDVWPGGLSLTLDGKRSMKMEEAVRLSRTLSVPLSEILVNAGIDQAIGTVRYCDILGHVVEGLIVKAVETDTVERTAIPDGLDDDVVAVQYHTSDTQAAYADGWITFLSPRMEPEALTGMFGLVEIEGDGLLLATIRRGYTPGTFNVFPPGKEPYRNVRLLWARRAIMTLH